MIDTYVCIYNHIVIIVQSLIIKIKLSTYLYLMMWCVRLRNWSNARPLLRSVIRHLFYSYGFLIGVDYVMLNQPCKGRIIVCFYPHRAELGNVVILFSLNLLYLLLQWRIRKHKTRRIISQSNWKVFSESNFKNICFAKGITKCCGYYICFVLDYCEILLKGPHVCNNDGCEFK